MTKIVLDTNVLVYALDLHSSFNRSAVELLSDESFSFFTPTKVISEYFAVCSKLGIADVSTWNFYEEIKQNSTILYPDFNSLTQFETLIQIYHPKGNRVYDIEIVSIALANGITRVATANLEDFQEDTEVQMAKFHKVLEHYGSLHNALDAIQEVVDLGVKEKKNEEITIDFAKNIYAKIIKYAKKNDGDLIKLCFSKFFKDKTEQDELKKILPNSLRKYSWEELGNLTSNTRNEILHAKFNVQKKKDCVAPEDLEEFNFFLRKVCLKVIEKQSVLKAQSEHQ